jgi:CubicO group peptidase (beta-lactamase class C family)
VDPGAPSLSIAQRVVASAHRARSLGRRSELRHASTTGVPDAVQVLEVAGTIGAMRRCVPALLASVTFVAGLGLVGSAGTDLEQGPPAVFGGDEDPREPVAVATSHGADDLEQLQATVGTIAARHLTAGASLALVEDGRTVWTTGLGYADVEARRPASADTVYRVGSLSKSALAITMASLEADGLLDLDAPVRDIVGDVELENDWEATRPVLVSDLLQHSAGFDEMRFNEIFATADQLEWSTARVLALNPRSRRARWQPGTRHAYSHPGYTLAGHIVGVVTGRSFEEAVRERVFDRLGMTVASYRPTAEVEARLATPYTGEGLERVDQWLLHHRPGSHLYVSAREMGRMVELLAGRGVVDGRRVMPEGVVERIEQGGTLPCRDLLPSYGLGIYALQRRGVIWFAHGGWMPGYHSSLGYLPGVRAGYVFLTNEAWDTDAVLQIESEIIAYLQRNARAAPPMPRVELEPAELEALAGTYAPRNPEVEFARAFDIGRPAVVDVAGRDLRIRFADGVTTQAVPVGDGRFRRPDETHPSMMFTAAADGTPLFYGNRFAYYERVPTVLALGFRVLLLFTLGALGLGVLWPTIPLPPALAGQRRVALRAWPCAGAWCVYLFVDMVYQTPLPRFATFNARTAALFALSAGIPICAAASIVVTASALRHRRGELATRVAAVLVTLGLALAALHFAWHGMIAVRTWLW